MEKSSEEQRGKAHWMSSLPYSGISRPSRDWGHVCPKHRCHRPCHSCPTISWSVPNLSKTSPSHRMSSQDVIICLLLTCIKLSICGDGKTKFPSEDITGPVGLTSLAICISKWSTVRHWSPPQMPSVQDGCCQKCSAWWPPPITLPFMSETLTLPAPSSPCSIVIIPPCISSSLSFLFWILCLDTKRENDRKSACDSL